MAVPLLMSIAVGVAVILFVVIARERRRARTSTLLWLLAIATRHNRPLVDEIKLLAETTSGRMRLELQDLAAMLQAGDPLPVALERVGPWVPQSAVVAAQVGLQTGTLAQTLGEAARVQTLPRIGSVRGPVDIGAALVYLWILLLFLSVGTAFLLNSRRLVIIPKYRDIFDDFGLPLPRVTRLLCDLADQVAPFGLLLAPILLAPAGLIIAAAVACWKGRDPFDVGWICKWFVRWETPTILRGLSHAVSANAPLVEALAAVQRMHHRDKVRRRVGLALQDFEAGEDCWLALRRQGILRRAEARLLQAAERTGDLSWALRELAASLENRWRYRGLVLLEFLQPALVIVIGAGFLFVCAAFFMPLVELIQSLG